MSEGARVRRAQPDPGLAAVLRDLVPLVYVHGTLPDEDVPAFVRAASGLRRSGDRLVIVQDEVNVLAVVQEGPRTRAVLLPVGERGLRTFGEDRGNKHAKMDLEACATLPDGRLVAFGSGSTSARERIVVLGDHDRVRVVDGRDLYAAMRATPAFAGSELNVEGALAVGDVLRLFQRGNGRPARGLPARNATCDLDLSKLIAWLDAGTSVPQISNVVQYDLGLVDRVPLAFTDAAQMSDGRIAFLACAESSPDTYRDGAVIACRFGIIDGEEVRIGLVLDTYGRPCLLKLEGIERRPGSDATFDVVADMDRAEEPALLGRLVVGDAGLTHD